VQFITITTDPVRDTPEVLSGYGRVHGLEDDNWVFLTSGPSRPDETRSLAEQFGHGFTPTEDGELVHGVVTHVIDESGALVANYHGLEFDPTNLVIHLNALVNKSQGGDNHDHGWWSSITGRLQSLF
jgi:protein SCO1/2